MKIDPKNVSGATGLLQAFAAAGLAVLSPASSLMDRILRPAPYQERLYHQLKIGRSPGVEPDRRTKGRRGAAKRVADRAAWNAGRR